MLNAKFSSSIQLIGLSQTVTEANVLANMLANQPFTLKIDLINTAFTCNDSLIVYRLYAYTLMPIRIESCSSNHNESVLSLEILLSAHEIHVQLMLPGIRTIGAIRIGFQGPGMISPDNKYVSYSLSVEIRFV